MPTDMPSEAKTSDIRRPIKKYSTKLAGKKLLLLLMLLSSLVISMA